MEEIEGFCWFLPELRRRDFFAHQQTQGPKGPPYSKSACSNLGNDPKSLRGTTGLPPGHQPTACHVLLSHLIVCYLMLSYVIICYLTLSYFMLPYFILCYHVINNTKNHQQSTQTSAALVWSNLMNFFRI